MAYVISASFLHSVRFYLCISVLDETDVNRSNFFFKDEGTIFISQQITFITNNSLPDASFVL
jgi:hypothetical protein